MVSIMGIEPSASASHLIPCLHSAVSTPCSHKFNEPLLLKVALVVVFYQSNGKVTNTVPKRFLSINFPQSYIITDKRASKIIKSTAEKSIKIPTAVFDLRSQAVCTHYFCFRWERRRGLAIAQADGDLSILPQPPKC